MAVVIRKWDDKELMYHIAKKDTHALRVLYEQTSSQVYGFALAILHDHHLSEDVMQETYIKIFNNAENYNDQGKLIYYILTIVRNLSYMKIRENKHYYNLSEELLNNIGNNHDEYLKTDNKILLEECLNSLTSEERQIIILFAITGLKHKEIAELINIPLSTVLSKYSRALKKLQKKYGGVNS
ncbi:MAG: sigma-70 family RNA polymerase sigma factor [Bacilli bacterium]